MKVEQNKVEPPFEPITVTFETLDEAAQLYAVCNTVSLNRALPIFQEIHSELNTNCQDWPLLSEASEEYFNNIRLR
jgi:hypothetical protein